MRFVIGDIHGEMRKLEKLVQNLQRYAPTELIFVGDYIDKGAHSREVVEFLIGLSKSVKCTFLLGNHEYAWLEFVKNGRYGGFLQKYGAQMAARSFGMKSIDTDAARELFYEPYREFFDGLREYIELEEYIISHSGLKSESYHLALKDVPTESFLFARYDFLANEQSYNGKRFVAGHTGFYYPFVDDAKVCIDTGAVYYESAPLTAFCIDEGFFVDSNAKSYKLDELSKSSRPNIIKERMV